VEKGSNKYLVNARVNKTKRLAKILQFVPYVRCIILNGSLAEGRAKLSSDIDILIITRSGRVFTTRFIIAIITSALFLKRSSNETKSHSGKFCFNYYLTDEFLEIPHNRGEEVDSYCAKNYSQSILVWGEQKIFEEYQETNLEWMQIIINSSKSISNNHNLKLKINSSKNFPIIENIVSKQFPIGDIRGRRVGEWWQGRLIGRFGDWFELQVKKIQIWLIEKDARTWQYPEYIVYNDRELRFHPPKSNTKF